MKISFRFRAIALLFCSDGVRNLFISYRLICMLNSVVFYTHWCSPIMSKGEMYKSTITMYFFLVLHLHTTKWSICRKALICNARLNL